MRLHQGPSGAHGYLVCGVLRHSEAIRYAGSELDWEVSVMRLQLQVNTGDGWRVLNTRSTSNVDTDVDNSRKELRALEQRWRASCDDLRHAGFRVVEYEL